MQVVANKLLQEAADRAATAEADLFARSSVNRYYYTMFLDARNFASEVHGDSKDVAHKAMPDHLQGKIARTMKREIGRAAKAGLILRRDELARTQESKALLDKVSESLVLYRELRVVADYQPEIIAIAAADDFKLASASINELRDAVRDARRRLERLRQIWRQVGPK